ncbi:DUF1835 domain-containing protein [Paenibacillus sp. YN15]|uniref:DUF1835 domain-containing protein n=1 Tax=Paenibacillus sp. YN15 TaxID=1742774 RepID=UPI000DCAF104|nr:DUF1835 domain-containing protein [Paenibacillus sp. YN15]RAV03021.1 RNA polymerase subunit sigma-24 [Paenibacillus sp. YN15]
MLHITNGDAVAEKLRKAGIEGTVLPWREDYTEGPVAPQMDGPAIRQQRGVYLEEAYGIPQALYAETCGAQEAALAQAAAQGEEIVLWMEHDLFDQTMQAFLLHRLAHLEAEGAAPPLRLQLVTIGSYPGIEPFHGLGQLTAEQLAGLYPGRRPVSAEALALGRRAWEAYASPDPRSVEALLQADTAALPFLREAFAAHLARFPSVADGLGLVERAALQAVSAGTHHLLPLFTAATHPHPLLGIGDLAFWAYLRRMSSGAAPLIRLSIPDELPRYGDAGPLPGITVHLTPDGQDVLAGKADYVKLGGVERILGGVHLTGQEVWRWDADGQRLVPTPPPSRTGPTAG